MNDLYSLENLPEQLHEQFKLTITITDSYIKGLGFIVLNTARDPQFIENHLLSYLSQDLLQTPVSILMLSKEGLLNVARRELRFLIELSIKLCAVQETDYSKKIAERIAQYGKLIDNYGISCKNKLTLKMLGNEAKDFKETTGRLYSETCKYVHLTAHQITERIHQTNEGRYIGQESIEEFKEFNDLLAKVLACSLVLLFHSVPEYVAGDWLVEQNGESNKWYFAKSKFIAAIDRHFDYKHERKKILNSLESARIKNEEF